LVLLQVVAKLVRVKDPAAATALEVAAGGRLYQVTSAHLLMMVLILFQHMHFAVVLLRGSSCLFSSIFLIVSVAAMRDTLHACQFLFQDTQNCSRRT
jgi:hypothetical protein